MPFPICRGLSLVQSRLDVVSPLLVSSLQIRIGMPSHTKPNPSIVASSRLVFDICCCHRSLKLYSYSRTRYSVDAGVIIS